MEFIFVFALTITWCVTMVTSCDTCVDVAIPLKDKRLDGFELGTHKTDVMDCIARCKQHFICKSVNYAYRGGEKNQCQLNSQSISSHPAAIRGHGNWLHYEIRIVNAVTDRKELSKKERKEKISSVMSSCYGTKCYNNATCEETCDERKFICRCLDFNVGTLCKRWKDIYSDFNLFFPGGKGNYVVQKFKDFRGDHFLTNIKHFAVYLWVKYEDAQTPGPLLSFFDQTKTILRAFLVHNSNVNAKLIVDFGVNQLKRFRQAYLVAIKTWTFIKIKGSIGKEKSKLLVSVKNSKDGSTHQDIEEGYSTSSSGFSDKTLIYVGRDSANQASSFTGSITRLNVYNYWTHGTHTGITTDAFVPWPMFWDFYGPIVNGFVIKEPFSSLQKEWHSVSISDIEYTAKGFDNITKEMSNSNAPMITASFKDLPCDSVSYLLVTITATGLKTPKRISYKQRFKGNVSCYGIFGAKMSGGPTLNDTGLFPFDSSKDALRYASSTFLSPTVPNSPDGSTSSQCGGQHFWTDVNDWQKVNVCQRCKPNTNTFTITTFVKCGKGTINLRDIYLIA